MALTPLLRASFAAAQVVINYPTALLKASGFVTVTVAESSPEMRVPQLAVMVVVKGRIDDNELRAWTFSLDGHNFYVLKLGRMGTVVYDTETKQWADWRSKDLAFWRTMTGANWLGMGRVTFGRGSGFATNIVAGDDATGRLWVLDPTLGYDEHPDPDGAIIAMDRTAMGQLPMRLRQVQECFAVYVTGSLGRPVVAGADITLETSNDNGKTWFDHGTVTVEPSAWTQEIGWRSIGRITAPGRLFRVTDNGALMRISDLDMRDGQ